MMEQKILRELGGTHTSGGGGRKGLRRERRGLNMHSTSPGYEKSLGKALSKTEDGTGE